MTVHSLWWLNQLAETARGLLEYASFIVIQNIFVLVHCSLTVILVALFALYILKLWQFIVGTLARKFYCNIFSYFVNLI